MNRCIKKISLGLISAGLSVNTLAASFQLYSSDFIDKGGLKQAQVFNGFGCQGQNQSPALSWKNPPAGTKSFALLVHDPDAPTGGAGWWHWVVINIPVQTTALPTGAGQANTKAEATEKANKALLPPGAIQVKTDFGTAAWGGPCPPVGDKPHRYRFTLHALKTPHLDLPADATAALAGFIVNQNSLSQATLTGYFGR
jgi:Raf kinase inhibitor-like YbhB/YbcL family protein